MKFKSDDTADQDQATAFLREHGLDRLSRDALESKWNVQWANSWPVGTLGDRRRRILFQWCFLISYSNDHDI